jgi:LTXXQ motif family protein
LSVNGPLIQVEQAVRPTDEQRREATIVADAFNRAAIEFETSCRSAVPPTALARLDATVSRLDATWRAVQAIEVALANFQKDLSDEQSARFNALEIAVTR